MFERVRLFCLRTMLVYILIGLGLATWISLAAQQFSLDGFMLVVIFWPALLFIYVMFAVNWSAYIHLML